jgi:hypothetical protein
VQNALEDRVRELRGWSWCSRSHREERRVRWLQVVVRDEDEAENASGIVIVIIEEARHNKQSSSLLPPSLSFAAPRSRLPSRFFMFSHSLTQGRIYLRGRKA